MIKEGVFLGKRYEILGRIGSGGMADVYKGKDHKLNRFVAIKVLKSTYRSDETFIKKFLSEAQAAAGLMHPNVVNVYDVGQDRGLYYMVMELVEGITLKDYIEKKGKLSAKETISISIQMVTGIQAAHNCHIIHRDIKPQNIIISKDGKVKVTDFGIARATTSTATQAVTTTVMGSVHYTSPEQARGGIVDEKSDISDPVYNSTSVAAIGVAAHECGHAVQHFEGYAPLSIRGALVPVVNFGSMISWPLIIIGLFMNGQMSSFLIDIGILLFMVAVAFHLITLPVEINASRRAVKVLGNSGMLREDEVGGVKKVLRAAAMTYVASAAAMILQLLRLLILTNGRRRND